ncbi:MAG: hypothetical protein KAI16_00800, partial [Candidatus Pacebacteria bacterium]|nr:hypothetical protein [Candidatus Paceibacterota bacterium]
MKKSTKIRLIMYGIAFVLPILAMLNCSCEGEWGVVTSCFIDGSLFRTFSALCYMGLLISAFMAGIPFLVYIIITIFIIEKTVKM